ncbi:MAG: helix-turn-helix transcriptional regulator [Nanobdellota archaeon]
MNQKQIGIIVVIVGIILAVMVGMLQNEQHDLAMQTLGETGSCITPEGDCLHQQNLVLYIIGWILSAALVVLGIYLIFFDKTQHNLYEQNKEVAEALKEARKQAVEKDKFSSFLEGFNEDEQKVLKAVHVQDGIQQSTLRYKTGMSKTSLSLLLKNLEEREIISRQPSGKTNKVFLKKSF